MEIEKRTRKFYEFANVNDIGNASENSEFRFVNNLNFNCSLEMNNFSVTW